MNAHSNGARPPDVRPGNGMGHPQQQTQLNPIECARYALIFMQRADFKAAERPMYDMAEALLRAIVEGQVTLAQAGAPALDQPVQPKEETAS